MNIRNNNIITLVAIFLIGLSSCQQPGKNSTGSEYMPDMGHSLAYEANHYNYYYYNTWGTEDDYYKYASPKLPVAGTVPASSGSRMRLPVQGSTPYYYKDTEEDRNRAMVDLVNNPLPITDLGLAQGKELYDINCAICHGDKGDGNGYLLRDDGGVYPVQPANFLLPEHVTASNGRYYHAIMYGKNLMGGYADKLSTNERWNVIHYIRSLQAKEGKLVYNQVENTLNSVDRPAGANYLASNRTESTHTIDVEHIDNHEHMEGDEHSGHDHDGHDH